MVLSKEKYEILADNSHNIKVVAGPGSGKTTLIVEKVNNLIKNGIKPNKILVITYTNKAAEDLEKKIFKKTNAKGVYVSTFHSFCMRFMREYPTFFRDYKGFKVFDDLSQLLFIVKFNKIIRTIETEAIEPLKLRNYFGRIKDNYTIQEINKIKHPIKDSYINYCHKLYDSKRMDFGDLINCVSKRISEDYSLQKITKDKFDYIFIDEYQDINKNQESLIKLFLTKKTKILVVGDKNQSIYGFRGSDVSIFDNFEKSFQNTKVYLLKKNYRSTSEIIDLSNKFMNLENKDKIVENDDIKDGEITSKGALITLKEYPNDLIEALETVNYIKNLRDKNIITSYSDIAILLRSVKGDSERFIQQLQSKSIPFEVIGDGGLFNLDYIIAILDIFNQLSNNDLIKNDLLELEFKKSEIDEEISKGPLTIFYKILEKSKYFKRIIKENMEQVLFNLGKFSKIINIYSENFSFDRNGNYLSTFYQNIKKIEPEFLDTEQPKMEFNDSVKILTLHKSKGLEFPIVIIPGTNKKNYKQRNEDFISELFQEYNSEEDMKRAFYVAITRAKNKLVVSYSGNKNEYISKIENKSNVNFSRFKDDIGKQKRLFEKTSEELLEIKHSSPEKEPLELTYYRLIEFWKCAFAYKLRFHYDLITPRTYQFTYGSILHSLLYHLNLAIKNKEKYDFDKLIEKIPEPLKKFNFRDILEKYLSNFKQELKNIVSIEKPFEFSIGDSIINGRIDLIVKNKTGDYSIVEFKSGSWSPKKEDDVKKQITLYALSQNDQDISQGIIYFFGSGGKRIDFKINKNQMELNIYSTIAKINQRNFTPNTGECENCVFNRYCICPYNLKDNKKIQIFSNAQETDPDLEDDIETDIDNQY